MDQEIEKKLKIEALNFIDREEIDTKEKNFDVHKPVNPASCDLFVYMVILKYAKEALIKDLKGMKVDLKIPSK